MDGRTQCRVAADTRRSTDLIQSIRCRLGDPWWPRPSGRAGADPMYVLDPGPGGVAGRFGS
jgi:hypothetical protein